MGDNVNSLIMSKKIVFSALLSLLFGILGAKASVGGFPTYPSLGGLPFKCIGSGGNYWFWITTDDADIKCKKNGKDVDMAYLCVEGGISKAAGVLIGFRLWGDFPGLKTSRPYDLGTYEWGMMEFSNGKELVCPFAVNVERPYYAAFMVRTRDMKDQDWESLVRYHDVKRLVIGLKRSYVIEFQTPTHVTFSAMLDCWLEKSSPKKDFKPEYSGDGKSNTVDVSKLRKRVGISGTGQSLDMVFVQGGTFAFKNQGTKTVNSFYIGRTEVTQKLWKAVMKTNSSAWKGDNLPVTNVTYWQALEFCKKLSRLTGKKFRLPRDVEWEFAARGGIYSKGYKYPGSDNPLEVGWLQENSNSRLHAVAQKKPNELGLYDMWGNCKEMCSEYIDKYQPEYKRLPGTDRRARGCDWGSSYDNSSLKDDVIMAFDRKYGRDDYYQQGFGTAEVGLRLVMEP